MTGHSDLTRGVFRTVEVTELVQLARRVAPGRARAARPALPQRTTWVASGLTQAIAHFGARLAREYLGCDTKVQVPEEFLRMADPGRAPVLVSYHGRNRDIQRVVAHASGSGVPPCAAFVGMSASPVAAMVARLRPKPEFAVLPSHRHDSRFVLVYALQLLSLRLLEWIAPVLPDRDRRQMVADYAALAECAAERWRAQCASFVKRLRPATHTWVVLYDAALQSVGRAWQSALGESGVGVCFAAELRDFTHGTYLAAFQAPDVAIVICDTEESRGIGDLFEARFQDALPVLHLTAAVCGPIAVLEHFWMMSETIERLARARGFTLAKPRKPFAMRRWANWG